MEAEKYNRSVTILCPTCGCSQFSVVSPDSVESELKKCSSCGREISCDELIQENSENIDKHTNEMSKEAIKDIEKELEKEFASAFKGNKFIKIK